MKPADGFLSIWMGLIEAQLVIAILAIGVARWRELERRLKTGLLLGGLAFALGGPWSLVSILHYDPAALMPLGASPTPAALLEVVRFATVAVTFASVWLGIGCMAVQFSVAAAASGEQGFPCLLGRRKPGRAHLIALALGLVAGVATTLLFRHLEVGASDFVKAYSKATSGLSGLPASWVTVLLVGWVVSAALTEELLFRGVIQGALVRWFGSSWWSAPLGIVLTAAMFSLGHWLNADAVGLKLAQTFILGLGFGTLARLGGVEASMVAHGALNLIVVAMAKIPPEAAS